MQELLDEMIKEEQNKMQTNNDFMLALTEEFNRKMDLLRLDRAERDAEIEAEYFELLLQREKTTRDFIEGNQAGIEGNNRFSRQVDILQKTTKKEIELLRNRKNKEIEFIEDTRDEALKNEKLTAKEREDIRKQAEIDIQTIEDKFRNDKLSKENDLSEKLKQNTLDQIQAIGDTYNAVFDLFSQLQSNALDVQLANAQTQHETQMRLFDDRMERELQLAGDRKFC